MQFTVSAIPEFSYQFRNVFPVSHALIYSNMLLVIFSCSVNKLYYTVLRRVCVLV